MEIVLNMDLVFAVIYPSTKQNYDVCLNMWNYGMFIYQ